VNILRSLPFGRLVLCLGIVLACLGLRAADSPPAQEPGKSAPMPGSPPTPPPPEPSPAEIEQMAALVRQLGDPSQPVRDEATKQLRGRALAARDVLMAGLKDQDPQIRRSCRWLLGGAGG
jgi:hypothetical protein